MPPTPTQEQTGEVIVAKGSGEYRVKRYIMIAILIIMGLWFGHDGFTKWPADNKRIEQIKIEQRRTTDPATLTKLTDELKTITPRSDLDILMQKGLFFLLPPLGIAYLIWTLYNSRGTYRLAGNKLNIPGHPEIDLDQVTKIDKQLWDRKGIAMIDYDAAGQKGTIKLDDFVYQAKPTRDIFKQIEEHTLARIADAPGGESKAEV